ncbi:thioredoxin-like protein [Cladochytrium replicatum]|nr:thioredoxin-like protein [Cladochytrium replicatum]
MADQAPRVVVYQSSVAGNRLVKQSQARIEAILNARKVAFSVVDVAVDEEAKLYMQGKSGKTVLPQIFVDGEFKGLIDQLEEANENGEVPQFLGVA